MPSQDELIAPISFSIKGAVAASGLSRSRIFELIRDGKLEARKDGAKTLVDAGSLRACVKSLPRATPKHERAA